MAKGALTSTKSGLSVADTLAIAEHVLHENMTTQRLASKLCSRGSVDSPVCRGCDKDPMSTNATDGLAAAARTLSTQPQSIGAILAKVNVLQKQANEIEQRITALKEQKAFSATEKQRASELCSAATVELEAAKRRVHDLTKWRDDHVCNADAESYKEFETLSREIRSMELRLERKEEHVQTVLGATHSVMTEVGRLKSSTRSDYLTLLQEKVDEQQVELTRKNSSFEERARLEAEVAENDETIRHLRGVLENAGVTVPDAPTSHRTRRLLRRTTNADVQSRCRILRLPVGVLRALAHHIGGSVRDVAFQCGLSDIAVEIQETATLLHCKGMHVAMDAFEDRVQGAMSALESRHDVGGLITYTNSDVATTYDRAVGRLAKLLDKSPMSGGEVSP